MYLPFALIIVTTISLILTFFSIKKTKTAIEMVNDMGLGWNLGYTFECQSSEKVIKTPDEQLTIGGNAIPTKKTVIRIKKYGFKTIRLPVTWKYFIDDSGIINPIWMSRVKEVVNWIIKSKLYCILNLYYDSASGNWLNEGLKVKDKYIKVWSQIANEFKDFNEYLVFESMRDIQYFSEADYMTVLILNQAFIDTVRNSGGKNGDRLLIVSGANRDISYTCSDDYKVPIDPSKKFAVSIYYYYPNNFCSESVNNPWSYINTENGNVEIVKPISFWKTEIDYKEMFTNFQSMKEVFIDKGIPIIIVEIGVLTEDKKEPESIRNFLNFGFSMAISSNGFMSCLIDHSNKLSGEFNYFDKENDRWYDDKIRDIFINISKGKYIKPTDYFISSNIETVYTPNIDGYMAIKIGKKKAMRVVFNAKFNTNFLYNIGFGIESSNKNSKWVGYSISGFECEKKYDGSISFKFDTSDKDFNNIIYIKIWWNNDNIPISFNYFSVEFEQKYTFFNYNEYIKVLK